MVQDKLSKGWEKRISGALNVLDKTAKKQKYDANHTGDGKKIKIGLKVFYSGDPTVQWSISKIEEQIYRRKVTIEAEGWSPISKYPRKLFVSKKEAVDACIEEIKLSEQIILRDMRESMARLDTPNKMKMLKKLKKQLK